MLDAAASLGNWTEPPPSGHYRGIAIGTAFNSVVAQVVEISSVSGTSLRVNRVSLAFDVYLPVNPGQIEAQMMGGIVHGLNAALYGQQTFANGAAQAKNYNKSRMIRMGEMPQIAVTILPGPAVADPAASIGGAGELGVPTFAPALANAYFKATGKRQRSLPFFPGATMGGLWTCGSWTVSCRNARGPRARLRACSRRSFTSRDRHIEDPVPACCCAETAYELVRSAEDV